MSQRALHVWLPVGGMIAAAWLFLGVMAIDLARVVSAGALGPGMSIFEAAVNNLSLSLGNLCRPLTEAELASGAIGPMLRVVVMWLAMSIAMMLPTAVPLIATYVDFSFANPERVPQRQVYALIAGYLIVWFGFSVSAAALQIGLSRALVLDGAMVGRLGWVSAAFLVIAGAYQFSALKASCLARCRAPFATFLGMWRDGLRGALIMGLKQGGYCLGCCWALMLLAFVGGVMNVLWMAAAMALMLVEKLPSAGERLTQGIGILLIAAGAFVAVSTALSA
ncbi:MAG: DUF2182 domain-containing protein [Pseudomonadota bacterium]